MGKIVAIGGGEISTGETFLIDQFIVEFAEKEHPKLLFIPTASGDSPGYIETIKKVYATQLGCHVDCLLLTNEIVGSDYVRSKILSADIIYVGGGDTSKMLEIWRLYGVDQYLKEAYQNNIVLAGLSAGSICWFTKGISEDNLTLNVNGLGFIPAVHCPHYNEMDPFIFDELMRDEILAGIAIDNNCALVIKDSQFSIRKSDLSSRAVMIKNHGNHIIKKELDNTRFNHLSSILKTD